MELQQRISHQRVKHIIDSYSLAGHGNPKGQSSTSPVETQLDDLLSQYPHGLIELALVETLIQSWLTIPMKKGITFLTTTQNKLKAWQQDQHQQIPIIPSITPSQFTQITGLDAQIAFNALEPPEPADLPVSVQVTAESA